MQIRKIGPQPADQFSLLPNALARDSRLSFRARGVMAFINSHADGYHVNAESLSRDGLEGRDACRNAMNELIACNYLRRVRHQSEGGQWRTDINVYVYGDAPPFTRAEAGEREVVDEDFSPTPENPSSVDQQLVGPSVIEDQPEDSPTSPSDAAGDPVRTEVTQQQPDSQLVKFPVVEQRKLGTWFGVTDGDPWVAAWDTAQSFVTAQPSVEYDPQAHLAIYLSKCREERRQPRSDLWLRFFIEDRAKHVQVLANEQAKHEQETPQEREDRLNKRLPAAEWGAPVETGAGT